MEAEASISGGPDGSQMKENPWAIDGGTGEEEDGSSQGRPQWTTQTPKQLTHDTPRNPIYVREMNIKPPCQTSEFWTPPPVLCMPEPQSNQYGTLSPTMLWLQYPWCSGVQTRWCLKLCLVQHHLTFHNEECHTCHFHADRPVFWLLICCCPENPKNV